MILCFWWFSLLYGCVPYILGQKVLEVLPLRLTLTFTSKCRNFLNPLVFCKEYIVPSHHHLGFWMFLPRRKLKASLCTACRRQDPKTGLSPTLLPKRGWIRVFTLQRTGKNGTGFLLKVAGMYTDIKGFKGVCFLQWADFRDPPKTYLAHFHLPVQAATQNVHVRLPLLLHPSPILITLLAAHMWIKSGAHWPLDFRTTSTPPPEGKLKSALHPKLPTKTVSQNLNAFNEIKGQKKSRGNNHKKHF